MSLVGTGLLVLALLTWRFWPGWKLEQVGQPMSVAGVLSWADALPIEADGRPGKELIVALKSDVIVCSVRGRVMNSWPCPEPKATGLIVGMVANAEGDEREESFVSWTVDPVLTIIALN